MNINIYCDESCHLENDGATAGVLGAVWCPTDEAKRLFSEIREIKVNYGLPANFEVKWTKVSPAKIDFYLQVIRYFFSETSLHYRAIIANDKSKLRHSDFGQSHDDWYYKMYYGLLNKIIANDNKYRIYLDYKDTRGNKKTAKLWEVLANKFSDFNSQIIDRIQIVQSHEVELIQVADLLTGVISYVNRGLCSSPAKTDLVNVVKRLSPYPLTRSTPLSETKFNLFVWRASEVDNNVYP